MSTDTVSILMVCEGNICRSPAAELLLRKYLSPAAAVRIASAGTGAQQGQPIYPPVAERLKELGVDPTGHASRLIEGRLIGESGLVLTATRAQASAVVTADVSALRRTFTLVGFARLVHEVPRERSSSTEWLLRVRNLRGRAVPLHLPDDDIADPYRGDATLIDGAIERIVEACREIARSYGA